MRDATAHPVLSRGEAGTTLEFGADDGVHCGAADIDRPPMEVARFS
jgi:hypothetical protein